MVRRSPYSGISRAIFDAVAERVGKRGVQSEICDLLGISQSGISSRLRGETSWRIDEVERVAAWLNVSIGDLYGGSISIPLTGAVAANPSPEIVREAEDAPDEFLDIPRGLKAFTVYDRSMEPLARQGQKVLVDPAARVNSGDLVVARILEGEGEGSWLFKRYERQKIGKGWKAVLQSVAQGFKTIIVPDHTVRCWKVVGLWLMPATNTRSFSPHWGVT